MSRVSIVVATFNGTKTIIRQLDSIRRQTRLPDEVIIIDDASSDNTVKLVQDYIDDNELSTWKIVVNDHNMGWKCNFRKGFELVTGDIIFPCDQDDEWHIDKLYKMTSVMDDNKSIELLVSNYNIKYSGTSPIENVAYIWNTLNMRNTGDVRRIIFDEKWYYTQRPGCTYCFRKSFYNSIEKVWNDKLSHDGQLWRYASIRDSLYIYNAALIDFWRYGNNSTSVNRLSRASRVEELQIMREFYENSLNQVNLILDSVNLPIGQKEKKINILKKGLECVLERLKLLSDNDNSLRKQFHTYYQYKNYYVNLIAMFIDWKAWHK